MPDEAVAGAEHERESECPEKSAAKASIDDAFEQYVHRLPRARKAGFEEQEAGLHEEDEKGRAECPNRVERIDALRMKGRTLGSMRRMAKVFWDAPQDCEEEREPQRLPAKNRKKDLRSANDALSPHGVPAFEALWEAMFALVGRAVRPRRVWPVSVSRTPRGRPSKSEVEGGAFPDLAFGPHATSVPPDDALHGGEANPRTIELAGGVKALERAE